MNYRLDDKEKIKIVDKIDNLKIAQTNRAIIGEYNEAIKIAEDIINLAQKANLSSVVEEQEGYINKILEKIEKKNKTSQIERTFEDIKKEFEKLIASNHIATAHRTVEAFKEKYGKEVNLESIQHISDFLTEEKKTWRKFLDEQEKIKKEFIQLETQFIKFLEKEDLESVGEIIQKVKKIREGVIDKDLIIKWEKYEKKYLSRKGKEKIVEKIEKTIEESSSLMEKYLFKEAFAIIDSTFELIKDEDLSMYYHKLKEKREDVYAAEIKYNKLYLKLAKYKEKFRENKEKRFLIALLRGSEKIIQISQLIGMKEIEKEYKQISEQIKKDLEDIKSFKVKEQEDLMKKAKDIENAIQIEEDVLPLVEEYSVTDFLGDLSNNIKEKLEQIGSLLNENRVEVKKEIVNKLVLTTTSSELIEDETPIAILKSEGGKYNVWSGLINRYEETIEKAIVTDLIPYNFKISEIRLNEELVNELPEKMLTKDGILLKWEFQNITPEDNVKLRYILQRRISRTILFVHNNQLKIIKTHVSLNETEIEGLSEAKLPFTNSFGSAIDGLIIEDIIPLEYLHFVEEPRNIIPEKTDSESGINFRWNVGTMDVGTLNYHHKLLDPSKFEETKKNINKIDKEASEFMRKGLIIEALEKFKEIRNNIRKSIE